MFETRSTLAVFHSLWTEKQYTRFRTSFFLDSVEKLRSFFDKIFEKKKFIVSGWWPVGEIFFEDNGFEIIDPSKSQRLWTIFTLYHLIIISRVLNCEKIFVRKLLDI